MTLFATLIDVLNSDILARIATYVDEPAEKTHKAVDSLVYTIVGGLMKRTTSEIGVNQLYNHIQKGRFDGSLTDNLATVLRDPVQTNSLIAQGDDVISHLLPAMKSSIASMISGYAGIRNSSAISLLGLTSTVVLHVLGKQVKDKKLDADGLAASLFAEREAFVQAVPDDFMPRLVEKVGLQQIVAGMAAPARRAEPSATVSGASVRPAVSYEPTNDSDSNESLTKWGVGALIAVILAVGGYYVYQNTQKHSYTDEQASDVTSVTSDTTQEDTVARSLAVPVDTTTWPKSQTVSSAPSLSATAPSSVTPASDGNLTAQLTPYLNNPALPKGKLFPLTGINFLPGSPSTATGSEVVINELATLLKNYPRLQIQLQGYANDAGGSLTNKSLSFKRVNEIKQQLVASGIDYMRIDAVGRGTGVPKNDTSRIVRPTMRKVVLKVVMK